MEKILEGRPCGFPRLNQSEVEWGTGSRSPDSFPVSSHSPGILPSEDMSVSSSCPQSGVAARYAGEGGHRSGSPRDPFSSLHFRSILLPTCPLPLLSASRDSLPSRSVCQLVICLTQGLCTTGGSVHCNLPPALAPALTALGGDVLRGGREGKNAPAPSSVNSTRQAPFLQDAIK